MDPRCAGDCKAERSRSTSGDAEKQKLTSEVAQLRHALETSNSRLRVTQDENSSLKEAIRLLRLDCDQLQQQARPGGELTTASGVHNTFASPARGMDTSCYRSAKPPFEMTSFSRGTSESYSPARGSDASTNRGQKAGVDVTSSKPLSPPAQTSGEEFDRGVAETDALPCKSGKDIKMKGADGVPVKQSKGIMGSMKIGSPSGLSRFGSISGKKGFLGRESRGKSQPPT